MFEVIAVSAILIYAFGVVMGIWTERRKKTRVWKSFYEYECVECYPGVTTIFRASTQQHLDQVVGWHNEDHHEVSGAIRRAKVEYYMDLIENRDNAKEN